MTTAASLHDTAQLLTDAYLSRYPLKAAMEIAAMPAGDAAELLALQPLSVVTLQLRYLPVGATDNIVGHWYDDKVVELLPLLDVHVATGLLARMDADRQQSVLDRVDQSNKAMAKEFRDLLAYPDESAGRLMDTKVQMFYNNLSAEEVLHQIKIRRPKKVDILYVINNQQQLVGSLDIGDVILADPKTNIALLAKPITTYLYTIDSDDDVVEKFEGLKVPAIPVLDANDHVAGVIRAVDIYQQTKEDLASDMASMVGASKDEKALSSSWFAVRKRLPWLQINLLTAFAAAAVVGMFEGIIAQFTALAILLPVAAGQSGNAGAQALAVTMRGLTLKEITTRHWWQVLGKETAAGFMNGVAIAVTCAIGVWVWSHSVGLALVMALAMITSLTIACGSGALVPILLKKLNQDPAQSSSIVLTTVTDIAGFMSFLGIATLLASMLPTG